MCCVAPPDHRCQRSFLWLSVGRTSPFPQQGEQAPFPVGANKPLPFPRRHGAAETPCHAPARLAHPRPARQSLTAGGQAHRRSTSKAVLRRPSAWLAAMATDEAPSAAAAADWPHGAALQQASGAATMPAPGGMGQATELPAEPHLWQDTAACTLQSPGQAHNTVLGAKRAPGMQQQRV